MKSDRERRADRRSKPHRAGVVQRQKPAWRTWAQASGCGLRCRRPALSTAAAETLQPLCRPVIVDPHLLDRIDHLPVGRFRTHLPGGGRLPCMTGVAIVSRFEALTSGSFGESRTGAKDRGEQEQRKTLCDSAQNSASMDFLSRTSAPLRPSRWPTSSPDSL